MPRKRRPGVVAAGASLAADLWLKIDRATKRNGGTDDDLERLGTDDGTPIIEEIGKIVAAAGKTNQEVIEPAKPATIIRRINPSTFELKIEVDHDDRVDKFPGYSWATADRRRDRVPRRTGRECIMVTLRRFEKQLGPDEPWELLEREEIDPLTPEEHRDLHKARMNDPDLPTPIASCGASWRGPGGHRYFPCLAGGAGRRYLDLVWIHDGWNGDWWFAGCRKVP